MSRRTSPVSGKPLRNKAQEERGAADRDVKRLADHASVAEPETWERPVGHSGTRRAWVVSFGMLAAFALGACGLAFGPRVLQWIGVVVFAALVAFGLGTRTWSDYTREAPGPAPHEQRDGAP